MKKSKLRYELIREFVIIATIPLLIASIAAVNYFVKSILQEGEQDINSRLESAIYVYGKIKDDLKYLVRDQNRAIFTLYKKGKLINLRKHLEGVVWRNRLSFFTVTDNQGKVFLRVSNPALVGDDLSTDPLIQKALKGEIIVSTEIASEDELEREGLSREAKIDLIETKEAKPLTKKVETGGLVLKVVMPVMDEENRIVGVMSGGYLLNRNDLIVDLIGEEVGAKVTIFLNHTRIATNVLNLDGSRAIGTMISEKVGREVSELGKRYIGRAWVVNAWYITAYEPIKDINGKLIGALFVGSAEAPFIAMRNKMIAGFALTIGFALLAAFAFAFYNSWRVTKPIGQLHQGAEIIGSGNLEHKIFLKTKNEIGDLADAFNKMTEDLKKAREELVRKERLAAIGEMSASIAHELKNSLTGIKVTSFYLSKKILPEKPELIKNLKAIEMEVERGTRTVSNILYFSRPVKPNLKPINLNNLIEEVISQEKELLASMENVELSKNLDSTLPLVTLDPERFKQVIINLIRNSSEAMSKGGTISITTSRINNREIEIKFSDTGCGISEENLGKIFTPFFTTKSGGIGLGLTVVQNIIKELQGKIEVESKENQGTTFRIILPIGQG